MKNMNAELFRSYESAIKNAGFTPCGKVKNLDDITSEQGGKLGLGMECLDRDLWEYECVSDEIKMLGIHMARIQSGWQKTEKEEGVYDYAWLDSVVDSLIENGIEPMLSLCYGNKLYRDDPERFPNIQHGGVGHMPVETERERNGWMNYVRSTISHYKDRIKHFEIWNEADVTAFLVSDMPWCDCYMELVKMTSPIIRSIAPEAKILSCTATTESAELLADMGMGDYVDIHSFHNYCVWPEMRYGEQINAISYMKSKAPHLRIWRGEAGFPSYNDPRSNGALCKNIVSEEMQAKFILRHIACDMNNDLLDKTFYFHAYDFKHFKGIVRYHYGVIRHEGERRKPAYYSLQMMAHLFAGEVKCNKDYALCFAYKDENEEGMLTHADQLDMRFFSYEKNGNPFFAYYIQRAIGNDTVVSKTILTLPYLESLKNPVILDPLTRSIYPIASARRFTAPVTDYPMLVLDASMLEGIADIELPEKQNDGKKEIKQFFEE